MHRPSLVPHTPNFVFQQAPMLDEAFDEDAYIEQPDMLCDATAHLVPYAGESNDF